jgi:acyl dehydratase
VHKPLLDLNSVDEQMLAEVRSWIGKPLNIRGGQTEASADNLRWFAWGIGDLNPLWFDRDYGGRSVLGTNVAPPTFWHSVLYGGILPGPDLMAVNSGNSYQFHDRLRRGDHDLHGEAWLKDAELVTSSRGITRIRNVGLMNFYRAGESGRELVAEVEPAFWRVALQGSNKGLRYQPRQPTAWSDEQLIALGEELARERRRGDEIRYWDEVCVNEPLGELMRGPYRMVDQMGYLIGERSKSYIAFDGWWRHLNDGPAVPEFPPHNLRGRENGHLDADVAHKVGMPGAYDDGFQRTGVVATLVTNWMGDAGFLRSLSVIHYRPVIPGDVLRITGAVAELMREETAVDPDTNLPSARVRVRMEARNHLDQVVTSGVALVELPLRNP